MMDLFDRERLLQDLWLGYFAARKNKRNTINALKFEIDLEHNIHELYREITEYRYQLTPSICFIVNEPVKREIFAAHFRDRVVHHYIINKLLYIFENQFIYDCYSCRIGKGTLFGINRIDHFMRSCTLNYTRDAYVLKLDLQGFFMSINRQRLLDMILQLVDRKYQGGDKDIILYLLEVIILNNPTLNCKVKGRRSDWDGLSPSKSLFHAKSGCGLPIGNLTSQIFANYYLTGFDRYVKETLKINCYGRYVDDFFIVHQDMDYLKSLIPQVRTRLRETVGVVLHPRKIYLQPCARGVSYLGAVIKPYGRFLTNRVWKNYLRMLSEAPSLDEYFQMFPEEQKLWEARFNSYRGMCCHADVWKRLYDSIGNKSRHIDLQQFNCNSSKIAKALASTTGWSSSSSTCDVGNNPCGNNATGFSVRCLRDE